MPLEQNWKSGCRTPILGVPTSIIHLCILGL